MEIDLSLSALLCEPLSSFLFFVSLFHLLISPRYISYTVSCSAAALVVYWCKLSLRCLRVTLSLFP